MTPPLFLYYTRIKQFPSKLTLTEISGSFGDLGTLIPLTIALSKVGAIELPAALFWAGVSNVITGILWDLPMPVQPMKAIAATAIAGSLSPVEVSTSGVIIGAIMVVLGMTRLIDIVNRLIPVHVVSGMQLGLGMKLAITGLSYIQVLPWASSPDSILLALAVGALTLVLLRFEVRSQAGDDYMPPFEFIRYLPPSALMLFLIAVIFVVIELTSPSSDYPPLQFMGPPVAFWALSSASGEKWTSGLLNLALPQLPLTTLNSVVSVCALAHTLYPERRKETGKEGEGKDSLTARDEVVSRRDVALSVGLMNGVLCMFGAMPNCHGAGGLAGQHKFGARNGASVIFLGLLKVVLSVLGGGSAVTILDAFPDSILGVLLIVSGSELAVTGVKVAEKVNRGGRGLENSMNTFMMVIVAVVLVGTGKTYFGVLAGMAVYLLYGEGLREYKEAWQSWRGVGMDAEVMAMAKV